MTIGDWIDLVTILLIPVALVVTVGVLTKPGRWRR